jgi:hypothetical protein
MRRRTPAFAAAVLSALLLAACSTERSTKDGAAEQAPLLPVDLVLMPIGDERPDRFKDVELSRYVRDAAIRVLARKGYQAVPRDELEREGLAAPRDLDEMSGADLAALGPDDADGLLFLSITRANRGYTFGGEDYSIVLTGMVVHPAARSIIWRDSGSGNTSLGGFLRIFAPRSPAYDAIYEALQDLFRDVPRRRT